MKNSRNYVEHEVVKQLEKKHDIQINGHVIEILKGTKAKNDVGIKSKGKIDFLQKHCGNRYVVNSVSDFSTNAKFKQLAKKLYN